MVVRRELHLVVRARRLPLAEAICANEAQQALIGVLERPRSATVRKQWQFCMSSSNKWGAAGVRWDGGEALLSIPRCGCQVTAGRSIEEALKHNSGAPAYVCVFEGRGWFVADVRREPHVCVRIARAAPSSHHPHLSSSAQVQSAHALARVPTCTLYAHPLEGSPRKESIYTSREEVTSSDMTDGERSDLRAFCMRVSCACVRLGRRAKRT